MTSTITAHLDIDIDRPAPLVWSVVSDYACDPRWRAGVSEMTPDRPGAPTVGTAVHEVLSLGGREYVTDTVITDVGPGMHYRFAGHGTGGQVRGGRTVVATADGSSRFTYEVEVEPEHLSPVMRPVMGWWMRRSFRRDLRRLREHVQALP
ncbi:MAG: SRPBCC family protein [Ilumatobacteraceae bacterium]|jgi:hypothetical protein